jgi:hypothetical protein
MVNPGHPSRACATCKYRRVRCDEAKPNCEKCTKSKRLCLGYETGKLLPNSSRETMAPILASPLLSAAPSQLMRIEPKPITTETDASRDQRPLASETMQQVVYPLFASLIYPDITWFDDTARSARVALTASLRSLSEPEQTHEERKSLHENYQGAIRSLRLIIARHSQAASSRFLAYMFALYEVSMRALKFHELELMSLNVDAGK